MNIEVNNKLGLCLSGGGFRASFYHVGVLAKMAELGILKHVEVISTVSGGSIVGAAYYLLLKELLESKPDIGDNNEPGLQDSDYVEIVEKLEHHFLAAVQKNLRMRTFYSPWKNLKMLLPSYSRSDTIGELYDKYIYSSLIDVGDRPIGMRDLIIKPKGVPADKFHPRDKVFGNQSRTHKVPVLVLNATSLNSGHNWCFTASWMGEMPPRNNFFRDMDKKDRYRRVYYTEIESRKEKDFKLGKAVAASAGVPVLFPPLAISNLYLNRRVELVDGGVFDNQGIAGVLCPGLDQLCSDFIVSDASGQSDATDNPKTDFLNVLMNTNSILTSRVREEMVNSTKESYPEHVAYIHLTRGLFAKNIEFNNKPSKDEPSPKMKADIVSCKEEFDVDEDMQWAMSKIRTDLDSFTDIEAGCLQADGYQMSESRLLKLPEIYQSKRKLKGKWGFETYIKKISHKDELTHKHLEVGSNMFFKPLFHLFKSTLNLRQYFTLILVSLPVLALLAVIFYGIDYGVQQYFNISVWRIITDQATFSQFVSDIAPIIYGLIITFVISIVASKMVKGCGKWVTLIRKSIQSPVSLVVGFVMRFLLPVIFSIPIRLYLSTIDKYLINSIGKNGSDQKNQRV